MRIIQASENDLREILALQYLAFQSEAVILNNPDIPPLKQTLDELQAEFAEQIFLKAIDDDGSIVGSVRYYSQGDTVYIGKLIVKPEFQGCGIGTKLLLEVEKLCPNKRYELFTRSNNLRNLAIYKQLGYKIFDEKPVMKDLSFAYLEKC